MFIRERMFVCVRVCVCVCVCVCVFVPVCVFVGDECPKCKSTHYIYFIALARDYNIIIHSFIHTEHI